MSHLDWLLVATVLAVVACILGGMAGFISFSRDVEAETAVLVQMKVLTEACQYYRTVNGAWPPNLEALMLPQPNYKDLPYIEAHLLEPKSDPNKRFQYDPAGPHNNGTKPDIWIDVNGRQIGNWMPRNSR